MQFPDADEDEIRPSQDARIYWNSHSSTQLLKRAVSSTGCIANLKLTSGAAGLPSPTRPRTPAHEEDASFGSDASSSNSSASSTSSRVSKRRRSALKDSFGTDQQEALQRIQELASILNPAKLLQDKTNGVRPAAAAAPDKGKGKAFVRTRSEPTSVLSSRPAIVKRPSTHFEPIIPTTIFERCSPVRPPPRDADPVEQELQSKTQELTLMDDVLDDAGQEDSFEAAMVAMDDDELHVFMTQASQMASQRPKSQRKEPASSQQPEALAVPPQRVPIKPMATLAKPANLIANPASQAASTVRTGRYTATPQTKLVKAFKVPSKVDLSKKIPVPVRQPACVVASQRVAAVEHKAAPVATPAESQGLHPELAFLLEAGNTFELEDGDVSF